MTTPTLNLTPGSKVFYNDAEVTVSRVTDYSVSFEGRGYTISTSREQAEKVLTATPTLPKVGDGATEVCGSDRHPFTVIKVIGKTRVLVQADNYTRTDKNGQSENQSYEFSPNPEGATYELRLTKRGWTHKGARFLIGQRSAYYDFSF